MIWNTLVKNAMHWNEKYVDFGQIQLVEDTLSAIVYLQLKLGSLNIKPLILFEITRLDIFQFNNKRQLML